MNSIIAFYERCKRHPKILLAIAIAVSAVIVYYQYVFGNFIFMFNDIGSDTQQQYIMQYNTIVNHLRDGNFSFWDFNNGFGTSMFQLTIADPSLWVLYLLGAVFGPESCAYLLIYLHIGKMVLAGLAAYYFLSCFSLSNRSRFLAAYVYAFNGFLIVWGQHYQFSMVMVLLPCLLGITEKAIRSKRFSLKLPLMTAAVVFYSYYTGYMSLILCGIYVIFRIIAEKETWKNRILQICKHAAAMLIGVGMALVTLLPNYYLVSNVSARMDSSMSLIQKVITSFALYPAGYYRTLLSTMFSSNLEGIGNDVVPYTGYGNYYEAPNIFFSTLFAFVIIQFIILIPKISSKRKHIVLWYSSVVVGAGILLIMAGSLIFNGFAYPFSRHTFLFMPLFAYMLARVMDEIVLRKRLNRAGLLLSLVMVFVLYVPVAIHAGTIPTHLNAFILCGTGALMAVLLYILAYGKKERIKKGGEVVFLMLCATVCLNVISDSHITARYRSEVQKGSEEYFEYLYGEEWEELLEYVNENTDSFYRLEKDFSQVSICMEGCAQNYRGIGTYNSTMNKNITEFVEKVCPSLWYENLRHLTFTQMSDDHAFAKLFGIRYIVSKDDTMSAGYHLVKQFGSLYLYESDQDTSIGHLYTKTIDNEVYETMQAGLDKDAMIAEATIVDDPDQYTLDEQEVVKYSRTQKENIIDYEEIEQTDGVSVDEAGNITFALSEFTIPFATEKLQQTGSLTMEFDAVMNDSKNVHFKVDNSDHVFTLMNGVTSHLSLTVPTNANSLTVNTCLLNAEVSISNISFFTRNIDADFEATPIQVSDTDTDSRLSGKIESTDGGLAVFAFPYEEGWSVKVDGIDTEIVRADYGFTALYVEGGEHTFEFRYRQPMLMEGMVCAGVFWLIYFCVVILVKRSKKLIR